MAVTQTIDLIIVQLKGIYPSLFSSFQRDNEQSLREVGQSCRVGFIYCGVINSAMSLI